MNLLVQLRRLAVSTYRQIPGRPFAKTLARLDRAFRMRNGQKTVVAERNGCTYELDLEQMIDSHIYYNGEFEPETNRAFERLVRPGMTVLDIGANVGSHTLTLAKMVGSSGHIYAFEPTEWAYEKLRRNIELNPDLRHITTTRVALSDQDASNTDYAFRSQYRLEGDPDGEAEAGLVDYMKLDTYCEQLNIGSIDFIKLDVDGFETKILRGAHKTLNKYKPILIVEMGEYWQRSAGDSIEALVGILDDIGYQYEHQETGEPLEKLVEHIKALDHKWAINVVCKPT